MGFYICEEIWATSWIDLANLTLSKRKKLKGKQCMIAFSIKLRNRPNQGWGSNPWVPTLAEGEVSGEDEEVWGLGEVLGDAVHLLSPSRWFSHRTLWYRVPFTSYLGIDFLIYILAATLPSLNAPTGVFRR